MTQLRLSRETCVGVASPSFDLQGSGFMISEIHAVTCFHVIGRTSTVDGRRHWGCAGDIQVVFEHSKSIAATCISLPTRDDSSPLDHDFAILELAEPPSVPRPHLPLAPADDRPVIGDRVAFSGCPHASPGMVTHLGMISGWDTSRELYTIQAAVNPGISGGALVSRDGAAIGLISTREGGIGKGLAEVREESFDLAARQGIRGAEGAESLAAIQVVLQALERYLSTGIGYARNIRHVRDYLERHPLNVS